MSYDFLKKNFFGWTPPDPPGGYFKEFRQIFIILGFKCHQMGQKMKLLSQKNYILTTRNKIFQKKNLVGPLETP